MKKKKMMMMYGHVIDHKDDEMKTKKLNNLVDQGFNIKIHQLAFYEVIKLDELIYIASFI